MIRCPYAQGSDKDFLDQLLWLARLPVQLQHTCLCLGQVEQVSDQALEVKAAVFDVLQIVQERAGRQEVVRPRRRHGGLAVPEDHIQRRAQLMADMGKEARAQQPRLHCLGARLDSLRI